MTDVRMLELLRHHPILFSLTTYFTSLTAQVPPLSHHSWSSSALFPPLHPCDPPSTSLNPTTITDSRESARPVKRSANTRENVSCDRRPPLSRNRESTIQRDPNRVPTPVTSAGIGGVATPSQLVRRHPASSRRLRSQLPILGGRPGGCLHGFD